MGIDDYCTSRSSSSSSHACKPTSTPHYISHKPSSLSTPRFLSFHADTSDAHDTPDTCLSSFDDCRVVLAFSLFPAYTLSLPSLSPDQLPTPESYTRVHLPLSHVLPPTTTLYLVPTSRTHVFQPPHTKRKQSEKRVCIFFASSSSSSLSESTSWDLLLLLRTSSYIFVLPMVPTVKHVSWSFTYVYEQMS